MTTAYDTSASLLDEASGLYSNVPGSRVDPASTFEGFDPAFMGSVNSFIDPYLGQVLDAALGRMTTAHEQNLNNIGATAHAMGAFGGSRHGILEGTASGEFATGVGELTANLNSQAFNTATGLAQQDWINQFGLRQQDFANRFQVGEADRAAELAGASGMRGLGLDFYNIGNDITDRQAAQGAAERSMLDRILQGGASEFSDFLQTPYQSMDLLAALASADARRGATAQYGEQTTTPGLFDYLSLVSGVGAAALGGG